MINTAIDTSELDDANLATFNTLIEGGAIYTYRLDTHLVAITLLTANGYELAIAFNDAEGGLKLYTTN